MIDTQVDGDPQSVRKAATFLGTTLRDAVEDAGDDAQAARARAAGSWDGQAAESYRSFSRELVAAADHQVGHLREAGQKFDAYAAQLERTQQRMADRRGEASGGGLAVAGMVIQPPGDAVPPASLGPDATPQEAESWDRANQAFEDQKRKVELYNRLHREVAEDHQQLATWVKDNLGTFWAEVDGPSGATVLADALKKLPPALTGFAFDTPTRALRQRAADNEARSKRLRDEASEAKKARRSGNPARRAAGEAVDVPGNRATARGLDAAADVARGFARPLPIIGTAATLGFAANEIAGGESPSKVIVGEAAGIAGGAAGAAMVIGGAAVIGVGAPVIAVAAGAAVVGVGVGLAAEYAYEHWVPDEVRDKIDEGLRDFGSGVADVAGDVGDKLTFWD